MLNEMILQQSDKSVHIRIYVRAVRDPLHLRNEYTHTDRCARVNHAHLRCHWSQTKGTADYHKKSLMPAHASLVWSKKLWAIQCPNTDRPPCFLYKGRHKRCPTVHRAARRVCRTAWQSMGSGRVVNGLIWEKWRGFQQLCIKLSPSAEGDHTLQRKKSCAASTLYVKPQILFNNILEATLQKRPRKEGLRMGWQAYWWLTTDRRYTVDTKSLSS